MTDKKQVDLTLADMWATYARAVIPPGTSAVAVRNAKFAFYGGASYVLNVVAAVSRDDVSEDAGVAAFQRLQDELYLFAAQEEIVLRSGH